MPDIIFYKDRFIEADETPVAVEERGHQFGDGVYEVVRIYGGRPFLLDWHLDRFERSVQMIGLENPLSRQEWVELINEALLRSTIAEAQVYWQLTRGSAPRLHTFPKTPAIISMTVKSASAKHAPDAKLLALPDDRWANAYVKSINLLPNVLAKETAKRYGAAEALYVRNGKMMEGGGSNLFFVRGGVLYTAPANRYILGGITRRFVLQLAAELKIPVSEEALPLDEIETVDEVFVTSTTQEILSISEVFTGEEMVPALHAIPESTPTTLVAAFDSTTVLWRRKGFADVTDRLNVAFSEYVSKFREAQVLEPFSR